MPSRVKYLPAILAALAFTGCSSEPEWVGVYEQCKETVKARSEEIKGMGSDSEDEQTQAMAESMGNMAMSMAINACEMIRKSCEDNEESATCKAYVEQAKQE